MGGRFKREETYVYLWPIHVDVWQKPTKYYKAIILQLKINVFKKTAQKKKKENPRYKQSQKRWYKFMHMVSSHLNQ